ncbi:MAG: 2-oxo acid dehydrogenase subunit E2 [Hyphomicrobiaceae bacterium]|nr:2-oxo acid dehydrogenase subunit E2 [Hyphomicrobiaceae bacterium]
MPIHVLMPALSPRMETGKLTRWLVAAGDRVEPGDVIAEVETATATMEVEAVDAGQIGELLVAAGSDDVAVDTPIATIVARAATKAAAEAAPAPVRPGRVGVMTPVRGAEVEAGQSRRVSGRVRASPLARRMAREARLDLAAIAGSGPDGRIVKRDIVAWRARAAAADISGGMATEKREKVLGEPSLPLADGAGRSLATLEQGALRPAAGAATKPIAKDVAGDFTDAAIRRLYDPASYEAVPHDAMRRAIAERLQYSKSTVPHFYLRIDCRMEEVQRARARMNGGPPGRGGRALALTVTDFLVKALALALQQVPDANVTWTEEAMLRHKSSDVGVAVAIEGGLVTPVIRHAELKSLSEISDELASLAERARRRRLAPHEYQGGATAISNLGMMGVRDFDAVINPPHATILAVGAAEQRPVVVDGRIEVGTVMSCSLSCDHRAVDGATGAEFLAAFKALIEDPLRMLV